MLDGKYDFDDDPDYFIEEDEFEEILVEDGWDPSEIGLGVPSYEAE